MVVLHLEEMASLQEELKLKWLSALERSSLKEVPSESSLLPSTNEEESRDGCPSVMRAAGKVLSGLNGKKNTKLTDNLTFVT